MCELCARITASILRINPGKRRAREASQLEGRREGEERANGPDGICGNNEMDRRELISCGNYPRGHICLIFDSSMYFKMLKQGRIFATFIVRTAPHIHIDTWVGYVNLASF